MTTDNIEQNSGPASETANAPKTPIEAAIEISRRAADVIIQARKDNTYRIETKSSRYDLVTDADRETDQLIIKAIRSYFPAHQIMTEETFKSSQQFDFSKPLWIVDPIDGTKNFVHGQLYVAVSIAFMDKNQLQAGVVYSPFLNELFHATKGGGAYLNSQPIFVDPSKPLGKSLISTQFSPSRGMYDEVSARMKNVFDSCDDLRRIGSAAIESCYVAAGRFGGYYVHSINPWDMAASSLIIREAGGICGSFLMEDVGCNETYFFERLNIQLPGELMCHGFYAASPAVNEEFLQVLKITS